MVPRRSSQFRLSAAVLAAALLTGACADGGDGPVTELKPQQVSRVYRLGIGDKLKVNVFGENDLSGTFEVNALGNVPMPLIGEMPAKGRGIAEFRDAVARRLAQGYLTQPKVSVEIVNYRPIYVHGEVRNGGEFAFKQGLKLRDAVAVAGGYTYRAEKSYVLLTREGDSGEIKVAGGADIEVLPGDNIRIPERFF
jgi:protein involved in polysaccharide export with SLBB domain